MPGSHTVHWSHKARSDFASILDYSGSELDYSGPEKVAPHVRVCVGT